MKKEFKNRIVAGMLTAIITLSTAGAIITPAYAAEVKSSAVSSNSESDVEKLIEKMLGIAESDTSPIVKLMQSGGLQILKSLCINLFDDREPSWDPSEQISQSTDEVMSELKSIETKMDTYHNQEMKTLGDIESMLDEQGDEIKMSDFYVVERNTAADHEDFTKNIKINEDGINDDLTDTGIKLNDTDTDTIKVIDKNTKSAYDDIVNNSDITRGFTQMKKCLDKSTGGYDSDYFSVIESISKRHFDETIDGIITSDGKGICDTDTLKQFPNYDENVTGLASGYECEMLLYYFDCLQVAQLKYQARNYNAYTDYLNSTSDTKLDDFRDAIDLSNKKLNKEIEFDTDMMNQITDAYNSMLTDFNKSKMAEIKIVADGNEYQFTVDDATRGLTVIDTMTAYDTAEPVTYASLTLDRDWIVKGSDNVAVPEDVNLNNATAYKTLMGNYDINADRSSCMSYPVLMLPACRKLDDIQTKRDYAMTFDLNLNGYTLGGEKNAWPILSYINVNQDYTLNINGDPDGNSTLNVDNIEVLNLNSLNNFELTLNMNNVNINKGTDSRQLSEALFMFTTFSTDINTSAHVNNCDITLKGSSALNRYSHYNSTPYTYIDNDTLDMDMTGSTVTNV